MSLPREKNQQSFYDVAFIAESLFEATSPYRLFREKILPALREARETLSGLYCADKGRPALEPVVMAGTVLLQFMEKLPDRQAIRQLKLNLGWKYALDLEWDAGGFHPTSLVVFRQRLVEGGTERVVFESIVEKLQTEGLIKKRGPQRIDSTHVLACVRGMSRLDVVRETLRLCLEEIARQELKRKPPRWQILWERYCESEVDYRQLSEPKRMMEKLGEAGEDMEGLLRWWRRQGGARRESEGYALLVQVFGEQFERRGYRRVAVRPGETVAAGVIKTPHDREAQWACKDPKGKSEWVGYKVQLVESLGEEQPAPGKPTDAFVSEVQTTEAIASDEAGMQKALQAQAAQGLVPSTLYADGAYISAEQIVRAREQGWELVGPAQPSPAHGQCLPVEDFAVDVERRRAICPAGKVSRQCSLIRDRYQGRSYYRFEWGSQCEGCRLQKVCAGKTGRRSIVVGIHHSALQERRREMKTQAFRERMKRRHAIEGTVSELVRGYGLRKTRYRGLAKTRLANYFIAAACNVNRWCRLLAWQNQSAALSP